MKLISRCGMNPLACQIIARSLDSASQFLAYCSDGGHKRPVYQYSKRYMWGFHLLQDLFSPLQVTWWPFT